jgi:hypothetical protein
MDTKILDEKLEKFFNNEGFDVRVSSNKDFAYEYATSTVYYSFLVPKMGGELHKKYALAHGLEYDCGSFFLGLLHEVGHHFTLDDLEEDEEEYCMKTKKKLHGESVEDNFIYFDLPDEKLATEWAINYINKNKAKLFKLAIEIQPIINNIYSQLKTVRTKRKFLSC